MRPLIFLDVDGTLILSGDADREWVEANHPGPALLLNELDFEALENWSRPV